MDETEKKKEVPKNKKKKKLNGFEEWGGYMNAKKRKLNDQFQKQKPIEVGEEETVKSEIFKGVSIFVNGYTRPTADELKRLMMLHGGTYHFYYSTSKTTHTIASNLPYSKIKNLKDQVVVTPNWVTDSIKEGRLLPHQDYLLYSPEMKDNQQRLTNFTSVASCTITKHESISQEEKIHSEESALKSISETTTDAMSINKDSTNNSYSEITPIQDNNSTEAVTNTPKKSCVAVKAGDPDFLSEFYNHSRLHHISTAGQELKAYVQQLRDKKMEHGFSARDKLRCFKSQADMKQQVEDELNEELDEKSKSHNIVMHLDMDCFFVSVGLKKHPELKGFPVAVTHSKGKGGGAQLGSDIQYESNHYATLSKTKLSGVINAATEKENPSEKKVSKYSKDYGSLSEIASCSYEARKAGLRNGMFLGEALRRCPNLKTIPYDFEGYSEVSKQLYDIVASYTLDIEAVSCDELYVDCTELFQDTGISPEQFAMTLRAEIESQTGCTASAGLGSNMLLARLATRVAKPNGQYYVSELEAQVFIMKQKVQDLPGVGYTTSQKLEHLGINTCADLQKLPLSKLQQEFGPKTGQSLFDHCRGKDVKTVQLHKDRKSVSAEINYGIRFEVEVDIYNFIKELAVEVHKRLDSIGKKGKALTLKLKIRKKDAPVTTAKFMGHGVCDNISKSVILKNATNDPNIIEKECCALSRVLNINPEDYRGVGIQVSRLENVQSSVEAVESIRNFLVKNTNTEKPESSYQKKLLPKMIKSTNTSIGQNTIKNLFLKQTSPQKVNLFQDSIPLEDLDQSVLNALPEDIRQEILSTYGTSTVKSPNPSDVVPTSKQAQTAQLKNTNSSSSHLLPKDNVVDIIAAITATEPPQKRQSVVRKKRKIASLIGAVELDEVRPLIREWLDSTSEPLEDDIEQFKNYLFDLLEDDLRKLDIILRYFYRLSKALNQNWKQVYLTTLSQIQQKMLQVHGFMLSANKNFPS